MKVAILGLGRFGSQLVEELVSMGVEVLAVDADSARVKRTRRRGNACRRR